MLQAATVAGPGCNRSWSRLQPYVRQVPALNKLLAPLGVGFRSIAVRGMSRPHWAGRWGRSHTQLRLGCNRMLLRLGCNTPHPITSHHITSYAIPSHPIPSPHPTAHPIPSQHSTSHRRRAALSAWAGVPSTTSLEQRSRPSPLAPCCCTHRSRASPACADPAAVRRMCLQPYRMIQPHSTCA